jgi:hypothetical protein
MAKKILLGVLVVVVVLVLGVVVAAMMQPDTYHVERSRTIDAPPSVVAPHLTDFRMWVEWNPWRELDPQMRLTYSDPASGEDAWYEWHGNDDVGSGKMTITDIDDDSVAYDLEFIEPFESKADTQITFEPEGTGTHVVWSMDADNDFMGKVFCLFMNMDAMIGADFERGLENLDRVARTDG